MSKQATIKSGWDTAYSTGKYHHETALPFVNDIITTLSAFGMTESEGYYPGCGNGRNFIALWRSGLQPKGCDLSDVAIKQLKHQLPAAADHVRVADFLESEPNHKYDYLISIQMFQHGDEVTVHQYFQKAKQLLKRDGILFLRVNSVHTELLKEHLTISRNSAGGKTIRYFEGEKADQLVHFYSAEELHELLSKNFSILMPLREIYTTRSDGSGTRWAQWETIVQKNQ